MSHPIVWLVIIAAIIALAATWTYKYITSATAVPMTPDEPLPINIPSRTRFDKQELEDLWISVGGPKEVADIASAVALGESAGDPSNIYHNKDAQGNILSTDRGLWQINDKVHPEHNDNPDIWFLPTVNAAKAVAIYQGRQDFDRWNAYKNGSYRQFLTDKSKPTVKDCLT